ncbi:hypothetical protein B9G98_04525 [Wickerhamiella sorbophila]|uniref:Cysteine-rich transmembrane CYSTM domain-containing protein n=1 Tax=Wickerhamiella sorbophila TaxID=45607 RepID=A0A2T0FPJ7_9ASCO|nr:hypothetical protein B9G98_04525 [Wickerhamiella sorbophila]PRT56905.1 hypothetical protein B9G98_04525 [Wickerhamiella sorbophila]
MGQSNALVKAGSTPPPDGPPPEYSASSSSSQPRPQSQGTSGYYNHSRPTGTNYGASGQSGYGGGYGYYPQQQHQQTYYPQPQYNSPPPGPQYSSQPAYYQQPVYYQERYDRRDEDCANLCCGVCAGLMFAELLTLCLVF